MLLADPVVVQRAGLLMSQVDHCLDLPGPLPDRQDLDTGVQGATVGMGGGPCLHRRAWPSAATGGSGFGRPELRLGAGQHDHPAAGDTKDPGGLCRRDELGAAGRDGTLPGSPASIVDVCHHRAASARPGSDRPALGGVTRG
jgi:hypothetical protein